MKKRLLPLLILVLISPVYAETPEEADSIVNVTSGELRELEAMHAEAQRRIAAGQIREAVSLYWEIILREPDDDAAYTNLGNLYLVLGDNDRAKDAFRNALDINSENEAAQAGFLKITHPDEFPN